LLPLVIKRQLKSLTIYSFLGFLTIIYLMIITIASTFDKTMSNYYFEYDKLKIVTWSGCLYTFPVFIFSFTTQINLLQCFQELEHPTLRRMHKVLAKQHFVCFSIYMFIGIFGYLSFPTDDGGASASFIQRYNPIDHFPILIVGSEGLTPRQ
jgi:amino acid permease